MGYSLKTHYNHVHEKGMEGICPECDKKYANLQNHMEYMHIKVACAECGMMVGKNKMSEHIKKKHTPNYERKRNQICDVCGKAFRQKAELRDHNNTHTGEKPYKCKYCSYCCASFATMRMHERNHLGQGR